MSDISRCDWVPTIEKITLEDDCRVFEMEGMGTVKEKILLLDNENMKLQYSAVETRTPIQHHLA
ncbi:SRPBCC family protein, partial [Gammaproteobacteria bacterium]|nr:SRPBCC family protein [Gammaproteobacteria bacterium]